MLYKLTKERTCLPGSKAGLRGQWSSTSAGSGGSGSHGSHGSSSRKSRSWREDKSDSSDDDEPDNVLNGNVLMVDQLWLWAIDSRKSFSQFETP